MKKKQKTKKENKTPLQIGKSNKKQLSKQESQIQEKCQEFCF